MLEVLEQLLILQERDRKISRVEREIANVEPERKSLESRLKFTEQKLESAKLKHKQIETERNKLELEVEAKKQQIEKYSLQQFQTKKNEEYRALANEIESCKAAILQLEDQQLELMEKAEAAQREIDTVSQEAKEIKKLTENLLADLNKKEQNLQQELAELESDYPKFLEAVEDESLLARYQRLRKHKGDNPLVGIERSVCGGCHMKLPVQVVISCQGNREVVSCPNCGRILYYHPDMDLAVAE